MAEPLERISGQLGERSRLVRKIDKFFDTALFEPAKLGRHAYEDKLYEFVMVADRYNNDMFRFYRRSAYDAAFDTYPYFATQELDSIDYNTGEPKDCSLEYNIDMEGNIYLTIQKEDEVMLADAPDILAKRLRRAINSGSMVEVE